MRVVVTHLSKVGDDKRCLAGVDRATGEFFRLKTGRGDWDFPSAAQLDHTVGGQVQMGDILQFVPLALVGYAPHVESRQVNWNQVVRLGSLPRDEFVAVLRGQSKESLADGFEGTPRSGETPGWSCALDNAQRSLCVVPTTQAYEALVNEYAGSTRIKLHWQDGCAEYRTTIEDARYMDADGALNAESMELLNHRIDVGDQLLLSCSISQFYNDGHWLIIAGIEPVPAEFAGGDLFWDEGIPWQD